MFQRVVSFLLMPALIFQAVCSVHAREGSCPHGPCGHDPAPHFHLCMVLSHEHHDDCDHDADRDDSGHDALACTHRAHCQENDAIYVQGNLVTGLRRTVIPGVVAGCPLLASMGGLSGVSIPPALLPSLTHPPPILPGQPCPLYLRTLTLLI